HYIKQLLSNRMMLGVFFGQYFINTITWFFLTWFPIYLVQEKGMSILNVGLEVQGDIQVVQNFVALADLAEFDPAELLAPYTGEIAAEGISKAL
ncbi:hypothetical protein AAIH17_36605, partial [Pseudomonas aeruginosa]